MKKAFYLFIFTIFLFACVFSNKEKDKGQESVRVTSPAPESDAAPSTDSHISVDTAVGKDRDTKSETAPSTASGSSESNNSKGSQGGKEMSAPPPNLDTVAVH